MPKVSVLMSVFNNASTVLDSIDSILSQDFSDFEFIIYDDGSKDDSFRLVTEKSKQDSRIIPVKGDANRGLSYALNQCIALAKGTYCARMDGDDLCDNSRFSKQVAFLDSHPEYAFVSTTMKRFDENGYYHIPEETDRSPSARDFVKGSPFCHAPVMIRTEAYRAVNGYRDLPMTGGVEDYDLWFRLYAKGYRGYIMSEPLYSMFDGRDAAKRRTFRRRWNEAKVRAQGYRLLHIPFYLRVYILKPLILGLIPQWLYKILR